MTINPSTVEKTAMSAHESAGALAIETLAAAATGALVGTLGGPPGIAIGAFIGGAIGATAGEVLHRDHVRDVEHDEELDREIGVIGGDIGAAAPQPPNATRTAGRFHGASLGISTESGSGNATSDGPIQDLDD